jgi:Tfp pilus assembly PilM family ATPase
MTVHTSFELHVDRCRVVEVHTLSERRRVPASDVQVRSFITSLPADPRSSDFTATLRRVRDERRLSRQATVTMWGVRSMHRFVQLPDAADVELRARAVREAADDIALLEADGTPARIAVTVGREALVGADAQRGVSLTAASTTEIERRLEPFTTAGFDIVRVMTPAMALTAVARDRVDTVPGEALMYVALAPHATCVAIVSGGLLQLAREIQWGHADGQSESEPFDRRLAAELRRSLLFFKQRFRASVDRMVLCGDIDNLRSVSGTLGAVSGLPVETLDSLTGIDASALPEPADEFRAHVAALRLAIAAGAEPAPYSNLQPENNAARHTRALTWPIVGGLAAALVLLGVWYGVRKWSAPATARDTAPRQAGAQAPAVRVPPRPAVEPPPPTADVNPAPAPPVSSGRPEREVVVTSILYSADRKLAIVNGRIARPGDRIGSTTIVEIRPHAIVVESPERGRRVVDLRVPAASAR